jgi:hypothetical protein
MPPIEPSNVVNSVTETTKTGYFSRIGNSFKGILFGILLFIVSFFVLYTNEGSVDKADFAATATEISATNANTDTSLNGQLVHLSGELISNSKLGDDTYLQPGNYVSLNRNVEVYSWVEESNSKTTTNVGGSQTTDTTYTYKKDWVKTPIDSSNFHLPEGHTNTTKTLADDSWYSTDTKVGIYNVDVATMGLPGSVDVTLNKENTILPVVIVPVVPTTTPAVVQNDLMKALSASDEDIAGELGGVVAKPVVTTVEQPVIKKTEINANYIYVSEKGVTTPTVGDMRVSYTAVLSGTPVTLFGKLNNDKISSMVNPDDGKSFYRAFSGDYENALGTLHTEYKTGLWIFRIVGFLMMWIGLGMVLAPLSILLDVLPLFGSISRSMVGLVTFVVSIVLSVVTIIISKVLHNPLALVVVVIAVVWYITRLIKKAKNKTQEVKSL